MISRFVSSSPTSGSLLLAHSLLRILCPLLSSPPLLVFSLSLSKINQKRKKANNPANNGWKTWVDTDKEDCVKANEHVRRRWTSLTIWECKLKAQRDATATPIKMAKIKKIEQIKCYWRFRGMKSAVFHRWWEYKMVYVLCKPVWQFLKKLNEYPFYRLVSPLPFAPEKRKVIAPQKFVPRCSLQLYVLWFKTKYHPTTYQQINR